MTVRLPSGSAEPEGVGSAAGAPCGAGVCSWTGEARPMIVPLREIGVLPSDAGCGRCEGGTTGWIGPWPRSVRLKSATFAGEAGSTLAGGAPKACPHSEHASVCGTF
jgi:hypothetical protein